MTAVMVGAQTCCALGQERAQGAASLRPYDFAFLNRAMAP